MFANGKEMNMGGVKIGPSRARCGMLPAASWMGNTRRIGCIRWLVFGA
jgi:hypothetical protein